MNKNAIKNFAVSARVALIQAVTQKAFEYEVTADGKNDPSQESVNGKSLTAAERSQRAQLIARIQAKGFAQTMEEAAYTWFNRFIALRFMEVNNYLPSHIRIFSDESGSFKPEVLTDAVNLEIDGLDKALVLELLENQENERLYQYIIITQCNALHEGLPEMFEHIGGWTELLFPKNLLREDSVIAHMVEDISEADWQDQVQIIGWLYQYYNTEPKDKVFANLKKNVKISAADIPAATQLFTPDWIVRYMVENSLGRLWTEGHGKPEHADWKYYLEEAEQEDTVRAELKQLREAYREIQPEQIRIIDPCMGSGHILVYAFDVLIDIYTACGWSERDAAVSILRNNLYGLDIDRRAYQLAYFAVMMKARQYNRRILRGENQPNLANFADVMGVEDSMVSGSLRQFVKQFQFADTYGSLMTVTAPAGLDEMVDAFRPTFGLSVRQLEMMMRIYKIISQKYDVVCTNPPYMGSSGMNAVLSDYVKRNFPDSKSDLFACFMEKCGQLVKMNGLYAMITQHAWMFISSYERLRFKVLNERIISLLHLGIKAFEEIGNDVVQTCCFVFQRNKIKNYKSKFIKLTEYKNFLLKREQFFDEKNCFVNKVDSFIMIPAAPIAYWVGKRFIDNFAIGKRIENYGVFTGSQNITGDNERYTKFFWEVCCSKINERWRFYAKGGDYRQYYGNLDLVVDWSDSARQFYKSNKTSNLLNESFWYQEGITYSAVTSRGTGFRYLPKGCIFDKGGPSINVNNHLYDLIALLNSNVAKHYFWVFNPSINLQVKDVKNIPIIIPSDSQVTVQSQECISLCKKDWDSFETSWDFERHPLV